jgi:hypothetical protein
MKNYLNSKKSAEIKEEIEKIYFRKIWKKLAGSWLKMSDKFKFN